MASRGGPPAGWKGVPWLAAAYFAIALWLGFGVGAADWALVFGVGAVGVLGWYLFTPRHKRDMQDAADRLRWSAEQKPR